MDSKDKKEKIKNRSRRMDEIKIKGEGRTKPFREGSWIVLQAIISAKIKSVRESLWDRITPHHYLICGIMKISMSFISKQQHMKNLI